jgi:hypothetical protein
MHKLLQESFYKPTHPHFCIQELILISLLEQDILLPLPPNNIQAIQVTFRLSNALLWIYVCTFPMFTIHLQILIYKLLYYFLTYIFSFISHLNKQLQLINLRQMTIYFNITLISLLDQIPTTYLYLTPTLWCFQLPKRCI